MADHQRIYPVHDAEAPQTPKPTAPLVTRDSTNSENGDPSEQYPPFRRTMPVSYSKPPKKRSCFRKCLCWTLVVIIVQILLIGATVGILFLAFQPKLPKYSVDSIRISQFNLSNDNSLSATFDVGITMRNPNKKIGIYYESGSNLSVYYTGTKLCEGSLPKFYQGHRNTTVLDVVMSGQTENATGLLTSLQQQQQTGSIPLNLRVKVPVRIKLGKLKLPKLKFLVKCKLVVDSLAANNEISIKSSSCKFRLKL